MFQLKVLFTTCFISKGEFTFDQTHAVDTDFKIQKGIGTVAATQKNLLVL